MTRRRASAWAPGPTPCLLPASCPQRSPGAAIPHCCTVLGTLSSEKLPFSGSPSVARVEVIFLAENVALPSVYGCVRHLSQKMAPFLKAKTTKPLYSAQVCAVPGAQ